MASEPHGVHESGAETGHDAVEMPRPTVAPMVLSLGVALLAAGVITSPAFLVVGAIILTVGLGLWIPELLPGRGHVHEPLSPPEKRPAPVRGEPGKVEQLRAGMPGYRVRLPEEIHPISAGIKGGIIGGLVMPVPALLYGLVSGHGLWYPVNLLAGMVLPWVGDMSVAELKEFHLGLLLLGVVIHVVLSLIMGLIYGVLLPTLGPIPSPLTWNGLLAPLLWTAVSFTLMGMVNPVLGHGVAWPWFILSPFVYGVVLGVVFLWAGAQHPVRSGALGGLVGGLVMPVPAVLWSLAAGHGLWYPINLLAGMVQPGMGQLPITELERFHADWLALALAMHLALSVGFGMGYGLVAPRLPPIPAALAWGGLLMPLLWTALSYALMGVVNPVLQHLVDWPWFVVSQFVFGVTAAVVVQRSAKVSIPPAGR